MCLLTSNVIFELNVGRPSPDDKRRRGVVEGMMREAKERGRDIVLIHIRKGEKSDGYSPSGYVSID